MSQGPLSHDIPADRASQLLARCREAFLQAFENAAREVIRHPTWLQTLRRAAGECFDELAGDKEQAGFEQAYGLTASRISLVHDEDLDFSIELINLDQRLRDSCERDLAALHMRLKTLLSVSDAPLPEESPVGSESVCRALRVLKESEDLNHADAMSLLGRIESPLCRHLPNFYREMERELAQEGIESKYRIRQSGGTIRPEHQRRVGDEQIPEIPNYQGGAGGGMSGAGSGGGYGGGYGEAMRNDAPRSPIEALGMTVRHRREASGPSPGSQGLSGFGAPATTGPTLDPGLAAALIERIESWLGERQLQGDGMPVSLSGSELGSLLSTQQAMAVEVVETVCAYARTHTALPGTIRALINHLRVPLLRLALRSENMLSADGHPAFKLVDLIANVGRTLAPDCPQELPICRGMILSVKPLVQASRVSDTDFTVALSSVEALVDARKRAAFARADSYAEGVRRMERREIALHLASRTIYLLVGHEASAPARDFLETFWVHVLAQTAYVHGTDSPLWASRVQTANRLLASTVPLATPAARQGLTAQLPGLIRDLEEGLGWIGIPPERIKESLGPCLDLHAALLSGRSVPAPTTRGRPPLPTLGSVAERPGLRVLKHKQHVAGEFPLPPEWQHLEAGEFLAIGLPDNTVMRGFVAMIGPSRQVMLVADGDSDAVLAVTARALAQQISSHDTRRITFSSLVEEAAIDKLAKS
ncbi:MAG: DUF1631 domain-containing protein [Rhodocyclales bacterium]|nr:DUF1631 domain-containing protein [Rhodocyclales bacterium]